MLLGDIVRLNAQKSPDRPALIVDGPRDQLRPPVRAVAPARERAPRRGGQGRPHRHPRRERAGVRRGVLRRPRGRDGAHLPELPAQPQGVGVHPQQRRSARPAGRPRVRREDRTGVVRHRVHRARDRHRRFGRRRTRVVRRLRRGRASSEAAGRGRRGRHRVADLHQRHHGVPEGSDAHPPQPRGGCARVGDRVPAEPERAHSDGVSAVPCRRVHRAGHTTCVEGSSC